MDNKKLKITALCLGYSFFLLHFSLDSTHFRHCPKTPEKGLKNW